MVTKATIIETLKEVYDPEIPINIVDLGLIYDVQITENNVQIRMTLTAPHCPLAGFMQEDVRKKLEKIEGIGKVKVELVWDPPWSPERLSPDIKAEFGM